jgi:hypothetical protein
MSENRAANFFWHFQDIYHELKPCRFAFIFAIIGAIVFLGSSKGGKSYARLLSRARSRVSPAPCDS